MDIALYIEQLGDIFGYFFEQFNFDSLLQYSGEAVLVFGVLFLIWFIVRYIKRKKAVAQFIENGICLLIQFPPMGDVHNEISEIIKKLYKDFYTIYGRKYYWSLEILLKKDRNHIFLYLPEKVYRNWNVSFSSDIKVDVVTDAREKFMDNLDDKVMGFEMELSKDFVFPFLITEANERKLDNLLEQNEWIMFQILCRPAGDKWLNSLEKYKDSLQKGKNPLISYRGCSGGFFSIIMKFFFFLGDTLTYIIHGSKSDRNVNQDMKQGDAISDEMEGKLNLLDIKKSKYAYETLMRVCSHAENKERNYYLLDNILNQFTTEDESGSNSFIVKKMFEKIKSPVRNNYFLGGMDKSVVDILSDKELVDIFKRIV